MRSLERPPFSLNDVLDSCIASKRVRYQQNQVLIESLEHYRESLKSCEEDYSQKGISFELYRIAFPAAEALLPVQKELVPLYENTFVKSVPTRSFYEALITSAKGQICPFCGERAVASLDHYLAKRLHPDFALTPLNMVPACSDCNKSKGDTHPDCAEEQVFHPYFDCIENDRWLYAQIVQGDPPGAKFYASHPENWSVIQQQRLDKHFKIFKLGDLYSVKAGTEIAGIKQKHKNLFDRAGEDGLREALREDVVSRFNIHTNSWQGALYEALYQSDWYCSTYFCE